MTAGFLLGLSLGTSITWLIALVLMEEKRQKYEAKIREHSIKMYREAARNARRKDLSDRL